MATAKSVWGIDIGQSALKALKLREVDGQLQADAFDIIEHPKILSQPDADRPQLIRNALEQFLARNDITNSRIVVAVPGQSSLTRFVKLPPVETKRVPSIVRFEAEQQIPFDINEVIWRWQSFPDPESPDVQVGIFAIKRSDVYAVLEPFNEMGVDVDIVQMAPLALYNFMTCDQQVATDGATVLVDIGADSTNLVIADGTRVWTRLIQIGGNNFTEALVKSFKLSFSKAEKLKRTAATSKYARQVFQAMRPVFADLVQEIQRSVGFYNSLRRETRFKRILGLGSGFRLPGLQKFLEQNLNIPVVRIDGFNALQPSPTVSAPQFTENVLGFAVAYGLGLQGLGLTRVDTNLLPDEIASQRRWAAKRGWFTAAAALLVAAAVALTVRAYSDRGKLGETSSDFTAAQTFYNTYNSYRRQLNTYAGQGQEETQKAQQMLELLEYRDFWPGFLQMLNVAMDNTQVGGGRLGQMQRLVGENPDDPALQNPRLERAFITVMDLQTEYLPEIRDERALLRPGGAAGSSSEPGLGPGFGPGMPMGPGNLGGAAIGPSKGRGYKVVMLLRCPLNDQRAQQLVTALLNTTRQVAQAQFAEDFEILHSQIIAIPKMQATAVDRAAGATVRAAASPSASGFGTSGGMMGPPDGSGYGPPGGGYGPMLGPPGGGYGPTLGPPGGGGYPGSGFAEMPSGQVPGAQPAGPVDVFGQPLNGYSYFRIGWVIRVKDKAAEAAQASMQ